MEYFGQYLDPDAGMHGLHLCLATFSGTALLCRVQVVKWHLALATDVVLLVVVDGEHVDRMVAL